MAKLATLIGFLVLACVLAGWKWGAEFFFWLSGAAIIVGFCIGVYNWIKEK